LAKLKCKLVNIYALKDEFRSIVNCLQEMSVIDIETPSYDEETNISPEGFSKKNTDSETDLYNRHHELAENTLSLLDSYFPEKKSLLAAFSGPRSINKNEFYLNREDIEDAVKVCNSVVENDRIIAEQGAEIIRLKTTAEQMKPWETLDVPLSFSGTSKTTAFIGMVAGNYTLEEICDKLLHGDHPTSLPYIPVTHAS